MAITVKNINKKFGDFHALNNVSLDIKSGELVALLGPSGSGKTTLLRIIAGLEYADTGSVIINGQDSADKHVGERNVGFVFQHYALFKHMTVFNNVAFGLKVRKKKLRPSPLEIRRKVEELLKLVHLDGLHDRYPSQLSGGQRQRVALARALAVEPNLLLLDEPFGALDAKVRKELRRWMRKLHDEINVTSVFVTHDQEEAMEVADRIVVMSNGKIEQVGTPDEVWNKPANGFVYDFLGNYNCFDGCVTEDGKVHLTEYDVINVENKKLEQNIDDNWLEKIKKLNPFAKKYEDSDLKNDILPLVSRVKTKIPGGKQIKLYARPHEIEIVTEPGNNDYIMAKIIHINPAGSLVKLDLERTNGNVIQAEIQPELVEALKLKRDLTVYVRPKKTKIFS